MTGLVESTTADDQSRRDDMYGAPTAEAEAIRRDGWFAAIGGLRGTGWLCCGIAGGLAVVWFIVLSPGEPGPKAEWFFGAAVLCVVLVALWQMVNLQRRADRSVADAAERLHAELAAAEQRAARERERLQDLHRAELESREASHRAEMDSHRRQADIERRHLLDQLQKQAVIEVSRAVSLHTQMLAAVWNRGAAVLRSTDRDEREQAMLPIFEQIGQVVTDFSVELANAHQIVDDDRLNRALEGVNEAVLMGLQVAQDVCGDIVEGLVTEPNPIPSAQRHMNEKAAEARRLAWDLLRSGLQDPRL